MHCPACRAFLPVSLMFLQSSITKLLMLNCKSYRRYGVKVKERKRGAFMKLQDRLVILNRVVELCLIPAGDHAVHDNNISACRQEGKYLFLSQLQQYWNNHCMRALKPRKKTNRTTLHSKQPHKNFAKSVFKKMRLLCN